LACRSIAALIPGEDGPLAGEKNGRLVMKTQLSLAGTVRRKRMRLGKKHEEIPGLAYSLAVQVIKFKNQNAFSDLLNMSKRRGMKKNNLLMALKSVSNRINIDFSDEDFKALLHKPKK
tara:strand:+ start:303 stop:656 length:354 start_codon:yes stop_codon:yes gene_type:complete